MKANQVIVRCNIFFEMLFARFALFNENYN